MNELENYNEILYIRKKVAFRYLTIIMILVIALKLIMSQIMTNTDSLSTIVYIVTSLCVILLLNSINSEESVNFFSLYLGVYTYMFALNILRLIPMITEVTNKYYNAISNIFFYRHIIAFLTLSTILLLITYYIYNGRLDLGSIIVFLVLIGSIVVGIYYIYSKGYTNIYNIFAILSVFTWGICIKFVKQYPLLKDYKINYIYLNFLVNFILAINRTLLLFLGINNELIVYISRVITFLNFSLTTAIMIEKLISRPYKILFSDIYEKTSELNEINKQIVTKNKELEFSKDLSEKKENMLKTLFKNLPIPLIIINSTNKRIIYSNSYFLELMGLDNLTDVINKKLFSMIKVKEYYYGVLKDNSESKKIYRGEVKVNGKLKYIDLEFIDNVNEDGESIVIFSDVTTKVSVDRIKETMQNKMMEESLKRDFLSNISHDLKTPINVIYSAVQLTDVFVKNNSVESLKKYNLISKHNCMLLIKLTNNLIDSSKIFADFLSCNLTLKNIVEVVEDTVMGLTDYTNGKSIDLIFDTNNEEIYVNLDEDFMKRIMLNTLSNAIKFTPDGGKIEVTVEEQENDEVKVYIKDSGVGMDPEFLQNAFTRYSMGRNNYKSKEKGTGIGLFVVKKLVEKQKGKIKIDSKVGEGTCIELTFKKGQDYGY